MSPRRSMRLDRARYVGEQRCFFTICTHRHRQAFTSTEIVNVVCSLFQQCAEFEQIAITAYCFMPDHLHLLTLGLTAASDSLDFINMAKQRSGFWYSRRTGQSLWQRYGWDRLLRSNDSVVSVVRYILMNPVKAGLAANPFDYAFSGSTVYSREELRGMLLEPAQMPTTTEMPYEPNRRQT